MERFFELDAVKGIALAAMALYHFFFDLEFFQIFSVGMASGFWFWFARSIAGTFIVLSGILLAISFSKNKSFGKILFRGIKIFAIALVITLVSWVFLKEGFIVFGILHFMAVSSVLAFPFLKIDSKKLLLAFAGIFLAIGVLLPGIQAGFPWLLWLGIAPNGFYSVDFTPIFPWFGLTLVGIVFGKTFYPNGIRKFEFSESKNFLNYFLQAIGRNSLLFYLTHQIFLLAIIRVFFGKGFF